MTFFKLRRFAPSLTLACCGLLAPATGSASCEPGSLVDAFSQTQAAAPRMGSHRGVQAHRLQEADLARMPKLAYTEDMLRAVRMPLAWHRLDASLVDAALDASGGALIVATSKAEGDAPECAVLTPASAGAVRPHAPQGPGHSVGTQPALLALLPVSEAKPDDGSPSGYEALRGMLADFRLGMRVGGQYAPQGVWVVSPWVSTATVRREMIVDTPMPGLKASVDSRSRVNSAGIGLTRGLTRDTALSLLLIPQHSRSEVTTSVPGLSIPGVFSQPPQQLKSTQRQDDTLVGIGLYSLLVRQRGAVPNVILQGRGFGSSANIRAGGSAQLNTLYELGTGWAVAATLGADAERPEGLAPSRYGRFATLGASAQLSPRWMVTLDAGQRELRDLPGSQSVQRLRVYRSLASMAYVALVIDQEGQDRRATVTFARPF